MVDKNVNLNVKTRGAKQAESSFQRIGGSLAKMGLSAAAIGVATKKIGDVAQRAAQFAGIEKTFQRMEINIGNLRHAVNNTISDFDLMQKSVQAVNLGIDKSQLPILFEFATKRARETGESVDYLVNSIVTGIGRQSTMILDNLGISAKKVQEEFKKTRNFAVAVGNIINQDLPKMEENIAPVADIIDQTLAKIDNFQIRMGDQFNSLIELADKSIEVLDKVNTLLGWGEHIWSDIDWTLAGVVRKTVEYATAVDAVTEAQKKGGWDEEGWKAKKRAILANKKAEEDEAQAVVDGIEKKMKAEILYAQTMAQLNIAGMDKPPEIIDRKKIPIIEVLEEVQKKAPPVFTKLDKDMTGIVANWDKIASTMSSTFDYVFTETLIRQQAFGEAFIAGLQSMIARTTATIAANSLVFGLMSLFTEGGFSPKGGVLNFITGGLFSGDGAGLSPRGGGSTVNINLPNVAMINDRGIRQIKQAISYYDRRH